MKDYEKFIKALFKKPRAGGTGPIQEAYWEFDVLNAAREAFGVSHPQAWKIEDKLKKTS